MALRSLSPARLTMLACLLAIAPGCESCDTVEHATRVESAASTASGETRSSFEPMPGGGIYVRVPDKIPKDLQANCHVCPDWCTRMDLRPLPLNTLIAAYERAARRFADNGMIDDETWEALEQLTCVAAGGGDVAHEAFARFLEHDDEALRYITATYCLQHGIARERARVILRVMADSRGELATNAKLALIEDDMGIHNGP